MCSSDLEVWDAARVREREELVQAMGRSSLVAVAVHEATGELAGFTEMGVPLDDPRDAHQWETLVVGRHRGRRLGLLLKVAVLRRLQQELPQVRKVLTCNATTNAPMIAVNEALGFVPAGACLSWQRPL